MLFALMMMLLLGKKRLFSGSQKNGVESNSERKKDEGVSFLRVCRQFVPEHGGAHGRTLESIG